MAKEWTIKRITGLTSMGKPIVEDVITIRDIEEYHGGWMEECFVTVSVKTPEPIEWKTDDYLVYRGETFAINYDPNLIKKAERYSYGEGFTYDNIKFYSLGSKLKCYGFKDVVLNPQSAANTQVYTSLGTFSFFCTSVEDFADRLQANLIREQQGLLLKGFTVLTPDRIRCAQRFGGNIPEEWNRYYIGNEPKGKTDVSINIDNVNCWNALHGIYENFELSYFIDEDIVVIGGKPLVVNNGRGSIFKYGKDKGLYEIERTVDDSQEVATKLFAYGSEQNMPLNYYANLCKQFVATPVSIDADGNAHLDDSITNKMFTYWETVKTQSNIEQRFKVTIRLMGSDREVWGKTEEGKVILLKGSVTYPESTRIEFVSGIDKNKWPSDGNHTTHTSQYPAALSVNKLMLPGFPFTALSTWVHQYRSDLEGKYVFSDNPLDPWIKSLNWVADKVGLHEGVANFDSSTDNEIYPTIENTTAGRVEVGSKIVDNGYITGKIDDFTIQVSKVSGFDWDALLKDPADDTVKISMKSGFCTGREFKVKKAETQPGESTWTLYLERELDSSLGRYFPYNEGGSSNYCQIRYKDTFVVLGIQMPDMYVETAAMKLLDEALKVLDEKDHIRYTYLPKIDELFMQRDHDENGEDSYYYRIHAGMQLAFSDEDLDISLSPYIDTLTIKENGNNGIPTYDIVLRDEKEQTTMQKMQNQIDSVSGNSGNAGSGNGVSSSDVDVSVEEIGSELFLSKNDDDEASGTISFLKGLWIKAKNLFGFDSEGNIQANDVSAAGDLDVEGEIRGISAVLDKVVSSEYTGDGMEDTGFLLQYADGRAKLVVDDLVARGKFTANELESRIWTYAGGNMVFSGAGSTIFYVEYINGYGEILGTSNINSPWLLAGRPLLANMVAWSKRRTVQRQLTDYEKSQVVAFRCYEYSDDGTMQTRNWWHTDDLAYCETLNHVKAKAESDGSYSGSVSNTVYHRLVKTIGTGVIEALGDGHMYDYVVLSNISGEYDPTYNDWPAAGDTIVQKGNRTDSTRRSMVTIEVTGDTKGLKVYDNIMGWYATGTQKPQGERYTYIGYNENKGRADLEVFGDAYIGTLDKQKTYVRYNMATEELEIKAKINIQSTIGNQTLDNFIRNNTWTQQQIEEMIGADTSVIQKQLDGKFDIHAYPGVPLPSRDVQNQSNTPANEWITIEQKEAALYDLYYDKDNDKGYRWVKGLDDNGQTIYYWEMIGDNSILASLREAAKAKDLADNKRRVFVTAHNYLPDPPYDNGDLWVNAYFEYQNGSTIEVKFDNDIAICVNSKAAGATKEHTDWDKASKYTDDSGLTNFVNVTYNNDKSILQKQIDGEIMTYFIPKYQDEAHTRQNDPASDWSTDEQKEAHLYDIWYQTDTEELYRYTKRLDTIAGQQVWVYYWYKINDALAIQAYKDAAKAQDTADGKRRVFICSETHQTPTPPYDAGDLWVDVIFPWGAEQKQYNNEILVCVTSVPQGGQFDISHWSLSNGYKQSLTDFINNTYTPFINNISGQVDQKAETWYQDTDPSTAWLEIDPVTEVVTKDERSHHVGDIWHNSGNQTASGVEAGQDAIYAVTGEDEQHNPTYGWVVSSVPQAVYDMVDGKAAIYTKWGDWIVSGVNKLQKRDLLIPAADITRHDITGEDGEHSTDVVYKRNKVYRCIDATVPTFAEIDYIDQVDLDAWINGQYRTDLQNLKDQADKKAETWYQGTDPSTAWYEENPVTHEVKDERAQHVGDLWYCTTDIPNTDFKKDTTWHYSDLGEGEDPQYVWEQQNVPEEVFDKIDGKAAIYTTWNAWGNVSQLEDGDLLIPVGNITKHDIDESDASTEVVYYANKVYKWVASQNKWKEIAYTDDSAFHAYIAALLDKTWVDGDDVTAAVAQKAIASALGSGTEVDGGLLLTSLIGMRKYKGSGSKTDLANYDTWGGVSGIYDTTVKGNGIAAWYGGGMIDREAVQDSHKNDIPKWVEPAWGGNYRYAKTLFRMDGTGYLAGGNITWDTNGYGSVAGGAISWDNTGVTINGSHVEIDADKYKLKVSGGGTVDIGTIIKNLNSMFELETINGTQVIKAKLSLYSVGGISALGYSSISGGGGGASALYECVDVKPNSTNTAVYGAAEGKILTYGADEKWYAADAPETFSLRPASADDLGGIKLGYTDSTAGTRNYAVQLNNYNRAFVNVPWTDHYAWNDITGKPLTLTANATGFSISGGSSTVKTLTVSGNYTLGAACAYGVTDNSSKTAVSSEDTNLITGRTLFFAGYVKSSGVTQVSTGTGLTGGDITTTGTVSINSDYQTYISHGESAYNSLSSYLPLAGGTMTGSITTPTNNSMGILPGTDNYGQIGSSSKKFYRMYTNMLTADKVSIREGSSSQFLKADGSLDSSTYLTGDSGTFWGQSWTSGGTVSGNMTDVGSISASGDIYTTKTGGTDTAIYVSNGNGTTGLLTSTNRGLYDFTNSRWIVATNGTNSFLMSGNVGINTTSPSYKLDVNGTAHFSNAVYLATNQYYINGNYGLHCNNSDIIGVNRIVTSDLSESYEESLSFVRTNGNYDTFRAADGTFFFEFNNATAANTNKLTSNGFLLGHNMTDVWSDGTNSHPWYGIDNTHHNTGVYSFTISDFFGITLRTGGSNSGVFIKEGGNVGIGVTDPSYRLDIRGSINSSSLGSINGFNSLELTAGSAAGNGGGIYFHYNGGMSYSSVYLTETTKGILSVQGYSTTGLVVGDANNDYIQIGNIRIVYDSSYNALKVEKSDGSAANFYATGGVASLGMASVSSSQYYNNLTVGTLLDVSGKAHFNDDISINVGGHDYVLDGYACLDLGILNG